MCIESAEHSFPDERSHSGCCTGASLMRFEALPPQQTQTSWTVFRPFRCLRRGKRCRQHGLASCHLCSEQAQANCSRKQVTFARVWLVCYSMLILPMYSKYLTLCTDGTGFVLRTQDIRALITVCLAMHAFVDHNFVCSIGDARRMMFNVIR